MNFSQYIKKLFLFLTPIFLVFIIMELLLEIMPNDFKYKKEQLLSKADSIETLILGGSHTFYDLNPAEIDNHTFNLAYVSQSLGFDYLVLDKFINNLPHLNKVVIMVAYLTYSQRWNEAEMNWRKFNYYRFYDITPPVGLKIQKYCPEIFNIPFKQCLIKVSKYLSGEQLLTCTDYGWCFNYYKSESMRDFQLEAKLAAQRHENGSMDFSPGISSLDKIINLCKENNIKIILISFPLRPEYIQQLNPDKFKKMINISEQYSKRYDFIKYYDYTEDPRIHNDDFYDADHLNDEGAIKFSRIIRDEVLEK